MSMIELFNKNVSNAVNKDDAFYKAWFGDENFTPEVIIIDSSDINCGAVANELEFARLVSDYYVHSFVLDTAEAEELEDLVNSFINLPRRGNVEVDSTLRKRFKFIVVEKSNKKRTTRWAILDAMTYFIEDVSTVVQIIEPFDDRNLYFQIRIEGSVSTDEIIFSNNIETGWIDQNYIGGPSLGEISTYLTELINRIKAAGVDFDILFIFQNRFTKTGFTVIGTVQMYKSSNSIILTHISFTKICDAVII